ncbi:MAG: hypothetical protein ACPGQL_09715 [Thermoplasmatota archaeon]
MLLKLGFKLAWFTTKFATKYIVWPVMVSAGVAMAANALMEKMEGESQQMDGVVDPELRPAP